MSTILLEATKRTDTGKGASRRLRRQKNVPAIIYGGDKDPIMLSLEEKLVNKALENEAIYSSVFELKLGGKKEKVILKTIQRHPYKPMVMHMDLQRVSSKDVLVKVIPLHFINEEDCKGVKEGGIVTHSETQVEVRCQAKHLPEFIEVDMADVKLNETVHLSQLNLPEHVELTIDVSDPTHDQPVAAIHVPKEEVIEEEEVDEEEVEGDDETTEASEASEDAGTDEKKSESDEK